MKFKELNTDEPLPDYDEWSNPSNEPSVPLDTIGKHLWMWFEAFLLTCLFCWIIPDYHEMQIIELIGSMFAVWCGINFVLLMCKLRH